MDIRDITGQKEKEPGKWKKTLGPVAAVVFFLINFASKLKFLIIPIIKFFPLLLKTGGTMILSIWAYSMLWGWQFALGFVLLILVHESGHLVAAKVFRQVVTE